MQPEIAYVDLDSLLFKAAQAAQQIVYFGRDSLNREWGAFESAKAYKNWIEEIEIFGLDMEYGFTGDPKELVRDSRLELKDPKQGRKSFDHLLREWVRRSGCDEWVGYVSSRTGSHTFRHDLATIKAYKGNRTGSKPHFLEDVRDYARTKANIKTVRGGWEVDDVVCALAQRKGRKGCVISVDKDSRGVVGTFVFIPDEMDQPEYSSADIVGTLTKNENDKVVGLGTLFWLYQCLAGDSADSIGGCKGVGSRGAYELLQPFSGAPIDHLQDVINIVSLTYHNVYGDKWVYKHHATGDPITASWRDLFVENSRLVYMKKSQKDECFWLDMIPPLPFSPEEIVQNDFSLGNEE